MKEKRCVRSLLSCDSADVSITLRKDKEAVLLDLPTECKLLLVGLMDRYEEGGICHINGCISGNRRHISLLKKGNYICYIT